MIICELCKRESNISYSTLKYGEICNDCMWKIRNSGEEKQKKDLEKKEMYKKYLMEM